jgi:predicted nucleic acid-binding protein
VALPRGLKMRPIFPKIAEIRRDRPGLNLKITDFWNSNSEILKKKSRKLCKKLDQILRTLMEKKFQISTVLLDKIQIESKT